MKKIIQIQNTGIFRDNFRTIQIPLMLTVIWGGIVLLASHFYIKDWFISITVYGAGLSMIHWANSNTIPYRFYVRKNGDQPMKITLKYKKHALKGTLVSITHEDSYLKHVVRTGEIEKCLDVPCELMGDEVCVALVEALGDVNETSLGRFAGILEKQGYHSKFKVVDIGAGITQLFFGSRPNYLKCKLIEVAIYFFIIALFFLV